MDEPKKVTKDIDNKIMADTVLFFDMDGTLVDTDFANFLSYKKAICFVTKSDCDINYNPERRFNRSILKSTLPNLTETVYERIIQKKEEYFNDFLCETILNIKNKNILFKYSKTNRTVLVTNCRRDRAMATLRHFGLEGKFNDIFYREFGDNEKKINKFENAILKLGIAPNFVIAFENEDSEIADAQRAGISIINPKYL